MARWSHPFPSRTRQLSTAAAKIVGPERASKIARRRAFFFYPPLRGIFSCRDEVPFGQVMRKPSLCLYINRIEALVCFLAERVSINSWKGYTDLSGNFLAKSFIDDLFLTDLLIFLK